LDEKTQRLFSNYMRIYLNRITLNEVHDYRKYELKRFETRDRTDNVIVEAGCSRCLNCIYISVSVISYLSHLFEQPDKNINDLLDVLKCDHCQVNLNDVYMDLVDFLDF
jgi:hypothetical protein